MLKRESDQICFSAPRAYPGGIDGGGRSPSGNLKIRAVFSLMSSEKCHITIFARPPATAMKFYYRRATADLFPSSHKIQITNISLSGLNIGGVIVKALESLNLDLVKCVACCMYGASSMSSLKIGVASVMKNAAPLSEYYHCYKVVPLCVTQTKLMCSQRDKIPKCTACTCCCG